MTTAMEQHATHRWADVTTYSDTCRRVLCFDCNVTFDDGPAERALTEPMESPALVAEKKLSGR